MNEQQTNEKTTSDTEGGSRVFPGESLSYSVEHYGNSLLGMLIGFGSEAFEGLNPQPWAPLDRVLDKARPFDRGLMFEFEHVATELQSRSLDTGVVLGYCIGRQPPQFEDWANLDPWFAEVLAKARAILALKD